MKGIAPPWMVILILGLVMIGGVYYSGFTIDTPAALDPNCVPGSLILPIFGSWSCETVFTPTTQTQSVGEDQCGLYRCNDIICSWTDLADNEACTVTVDPDLILISHSSNIITVPYQSSVTIISNPAPWVGYDPILIQYNPSRLHYQDATGRNFYVAGGCYLDNHIGVQEYNALPLEYKGQKLNRDQTVEMIVRWQAYPYPFNVFEWNNQDVSCRIEGTQSVLYSIDQHNAGPAACYYYEESLLQYVDCCPGSVRPQDGATCGTDLTWQTTGTNTGCCSGGWCSDTKCPGQGGWDWDSWDPNEDLVQYTCNEGTGLCDVSNTRNVQCNPADNYGCPVTQFCDPVTFTCQTQQQPQLSCVQSGYECCLPGMFPNVYDTRTCQEAGFADGYTCVNGFCTEPSPFCNNNEVCELQAGETAQNCPDCAGPSIIDAIINFVIAFLIVFAILFIIVFVFSRNATISFLAAFLVALGIAIVFTGVLQAISSWSPL